MPDRPPTVVNARLIRALRTYFSMTREDLAERTGLSMSLLATLESSLPNNPSLKTLDLIAKSFHVRVDQLLCVESPEPANAALAEALRKTLSPCSSQTRM